MEREVAQWENLGHHALLQRFILITGQPFRAQPLPARYRRAKPRECFGNAIALAKRSKGRLVYVEGYAMRDKLPGLLVHHAWCVDERGDVIDPTWADPEAASYFGRVFSLAEWERETDRTETMSALDGCGLNHVFMFDAAPGLRDAIERVRKEKPRTLAALGAERSLPHDGKSDQTNGESTAC
jgi:hypothetical protein